MRERWQKYLGQGDDFGDQYQRPGGQWSTKPGDEWQQYMDYYLMGSGAFSSGVILDFEGRTLATSYDIQVTEKEGYLLGALVDEPENLGSRSVRIGGHEYANLGHEVRTLYGSNGFNGFLAAKSKTALVACLYVEGQPRSDASNVLEKFVDFLVKKGL
ncbi:profilin [Streptomyces sp. NPDC127108]|uniref:profilin n=1 Tax=Streptomyces sp. NPDC127108 TaxID=3345361 RepID=UPI003632F2FE